MKRVIVTGANGFVGSNIVSSLIDQGWYVDAVDLVFDNPAVTEWNRDQVELITSSCTALPNTTADALIHGAFITASPEARNESPEANLRANIDPLLAMMEYAEQHNIPRSIYISSSAVYRHLPDTLINEEHPANPIGVYAVAKTMMENLVETMRTVYQRDMICIRLGNIFGLNEYQRPSRPFLSVIGDMFHTALNDHTITLHHPDEVREWTFASDIGRAIHALLTPQKLNHSLYHVASGERASNLEIAQTIQNALPDTNIEINEAKSGNKPKLTRLGTLDNTRLAQDTGFNGWTTISEGIHQLGLTSRLQGQSHA